MGEKLVMRILNAICLLVEYFFNHFCSAKNDIIVEWTAEIANFKVTGEHIKMELQEGKEVKLSVSLKTKSGHTAKYQTGTAAFTSSDPAVVVIADRDEPTNELKAIAQSVDGSNNIAVLVTFTADGDPAEDVVKPVITTFDFVATQGNAVVAEGTTGAVTDIPE